MFQQLYPAQRARFDALARVWLNAGATAVSVWGNNQLLDQWPADSKLDQVPDIVAPIRIGESAMGEIRVAGFKNTKLRTQSAVEAALMSEVAKLETELASARRVQQSFLPKNAPSIEGIELFAESHPALQVSGDYYDFINQPHKPLLFTVGDVSNKGVSAALLMAMIQKVLRTTVKILSRPTPATMLGYANDDMYDEFTAAGMFATAFIGQFDPDSRMLTYANAGHSPVIFRPVGGSARLLEAENAPVGVLSHNSFVNRTLHLAPGDLLIVATDGFTEARNGSGEMYGYENLLNLIDCVAAESAQSIASAIFEAVNDFKVSILREDDQTVLVMKGVGST